MSVKKLFLLAVACLFVACKSEHKVPEDLIAEGKMIELIVDIREAEGKVGSLNLPADSSEKLYKLVERRIFEEHNVDSTAYKNSYQYYLLNAEEGLKISDAVLDSLKVRQQINNKKK